MSLESISKLSDCFALTDKDRKDHNMDCHVATRKDGLDSD